MPNHPGSRGHSQCLNPNLNPKALFFPQCIMKLCMVSINYFIAWCLERESQDILTIALNITLDLHKWQQSERWPSQTVRKTVYGLHNQLKKQSWHSDWQSPSIPSEMRTRVSYFPVITKEKEKHYAGFPLCSKEGIRCLIVKMLHVDGPPLTFHWLASECFSSKT